MKLRFYLFYLIVLSCSSVYSQATVTTFSTASSTTQVTGTFTVPCGVTSIAVQCWAGGGGGAGDGATSVSSGGGGGAGGYSSSTITVTPGSTISYTVGAGGAGGCGGGGGCPAAGGSGSAGGATTFSTVTASGGSGGAAGNGAGGAGGAGSTTNGAAGSAGANSASGAGGAAGGGSTATAGLAADGDGNNATSPGSGGSGANNLSGSTNSGGNGANGKITITYTPAANSGCDPCHPLNISTSPYTYTGTTSGGFNYMVGGCSGNYAGVSGNGNDMFFAVTVAANSYYTFQLTGLSTSNNMELSVLSAAACGGPWTCLSNGAWSGGLQNINTSGVVQTQTPCRKVYFQTAGTYYIRVDGNSGSNGAFTLSATSYTAATSTQGDACLNPNTLTSGVGTTVNNTNCTFSIGAEDPSPSSLFCAGTVENSNWLAFTASGVGGNITFNVNGVTCNTGYYTAGPPAAFYSASGQFGILTSSTNNCGGTYSQAVACQSLSTGSTYSGTLTNTAGTNYFFVWDGNGGAECQYTITATNVVPLPVQLISFDAKKNVNQVDLKWKTASEENCSHFTLQRSLDAIDFKTIGTVEAAGNSKVTIAYDFTDFEPYTEGISYYRLLQTDFNGDETVSSMKAVEYTKTAKGNILVYPNPASRGEAKLKLVNFDAEYVLVTLEDCNGKVVYSTIHDVIDGEIHLNAELDAGIYMLKVSSGKEGIVKKFAVTQ